MQSSAVTGANTSAAKLHWSGCHKDMRCDMHTCLAITTASSSSSSEADSEADSESDSEADSESDSEADSSSCLQPCNSTRTITQQLVPACNLEAKCLIWV